MTNTTTTYKTSCKKCGCEAYYYRKQLLLEMEIKDFEQEKKSEDISVTCNGCDNGEHTFTYKFPKDFKEV